MKHGQKKTFLECLKYFSQVEGLWLYTDIYDRDGKLIDPCEGDSGGPLAINRNGEWELVGVLKVCFKE